MKIKTLAQAAKKEGRTEKQIIDFLKKLEAKMPISMYEANSTQQKIEHNNTGHEFKHSFEIVPTCQPVIVSDQTTIYTEKVEALRPVNHGRRLRKAFIENGYQGVRDYQKWVSANNEMLNKKYGMKVMMELTNKLIGINIQTILK